MSGKLSDGVLVRQQGFQHYLYPDFSVLSVPPSILFLIFSLPQVRGDLPGGGFPGYTVPLKISLNESDSLLSDDVYIRHGCHMPVP